MQCKQINNRLEFKVKAMAITCNKEQKVAYMKVPQGLSTNIQCKTSSNHLEFRVEITATASNKAQKVGYMKNLLMELNIGHEDLALWAKIFLMVQQRTTSQNPLNSKTGQ